ncbi:MAG: guanylate kinase [Cyclobacteriaceae bacterium]
MEGKALIFSAPSGSGKTTIVRHLLKVNPKLKFSISATTRKPRGNEVDGIDYYFLSSEDFLKREFIEKEEVYDGVYYGTLKSEVEKIWANGDTVIFDVDVKGGINLKKHFGENALSVFVKAPNLEAIKERLANRKTESQQELQKRLQKAEFEATFADQFDVVLLNDDLNAALKKAETLVVNFLD